MDLFKKEHTGIWLIILTAVISGFSLFLNAFAVKGFDASVFTFAKNIVVAVLIFAIILAVGQWKHLKELTKKQWLKLSIIGLIGGSIPFLLFFKGLQMTTGTLGSFMHKLLFVFAIILALIFLKEKLNKNIIVGAALLMLGMFLIIQPSFSWSAAHLLILAAVIFWAAENVYAKHVLKELSGTVVAFGRMFFGSVFILAYLAVTQKTALITRMTTAQYSWILLTGFLLLIYVLTYYNGLKHTSVSTATSILTISVPITAALSWIFQGKTFGVAEGIGMILLMTGIVTILWFKNFVTWIQKARDKIYERY